MAACDIVLPVWAWELVASFAAKPGAALTFFATASFVRTPEALWTIMARMLVLQEGRGAWRREHLVCVAGVRSSWEIYVHGRFLRVIPGQVWLHLAPYLGKKAMAVVMNPNVQVQATVQSELGMNVYSVAIVFPPLILPFVAVLKMAVVDPKEDEFEDTDSDVEMETPVVVPPVAPASDPHSVFGASEEEEEDDEDYGNGEEAPPEEVEVEVERAEMVLSSGEELD
eukprot:s443_g8.t1